MLNTQHTDVIVRHRDRWYCWPLFTLSQSSLKTNTCVPPDRNAKFLLIVKIFSEMILINVTRKFHISYKYKTWKIEIWLVSLFPQNLSNKPMHAYKWQTGFWDSNRRAMQSHSWLQSICKATFICDCYLVPCICISLWFVFVFSLNLQKNLIFTSTLCLAQTGTRVAVVKREIEREPNESFGRLLSCCDFTMLSAGTGVVCLTKLSSAFLSFCFITAVNHTLEIRTGCFKKMQNPK